MQKTAVNQFWTYPVTWECARAAYPLVCLHDTCITLETWLRFVRRRCRASSGRTGLMMVRDNRGIIHALFSYRVDHDLQLRKRLCITDLIVAQLPGSQIDDAITASARAIAASLGCQSITVVEPFRPELGIAASGPVEMGGDLGLSVGSHRH